MSLIKLLTMAFQIRQDITITYNPKNPFLSQMCGSQLSNGCLNEPQSFQYTCSNNCQSYHIHEHHGYYEITCDDGRVVKIRKMPSYETLVNSR